MTGLLEQRGNYPNSKYTYALGGNGKAKESNGKLGIDCSNLLHQMLLEAGYEIKYENTDALRRSIYFDRVEPDDVKPGDVVLWFNAESNDKKRKDLKHVGVIERYDSVANAGEFFGSQSSTGPASAKFGNKKHSFSWPSATAFIRPKQRYRKADIVAQSVKLPAQAQTSKASAVSTAPTRFSFPFHQSNGKPYQSESAVFSALNSETSGNYLIGKGNFFHGGIHITDKVAPHCKDKDMVRCIADGTVVAYRLNKNYLAVSHLGEKLSYSNSFCLVRHDYASTPGSSGKRNTLTFYSLYMHLATHRAYANTATIQTYKVTESRLRARNKPELGDDFIGYINVGAQIDVSDTQDVAKDGVTYVFAKGIIKSGRVKNDAGKITAEKGNTVWLAIEKKGKAPDRYAIPDAAGAPSVPCYWPDSPAFDNVVTCEIPIKAGDPIGRLGLYEILASGTGGVVSKHQIHLEVFTFDPTLDAFLKNKAGVKQGAIYHHLKQGTKLWGKSESQSGVAFYQTENALPRDFVYSPGAPKSRDKEGKEWLEVEFQTQSQQFHGYVPVDSAEMVGHHDWEKMGFQRTEAPANFDGYFPPVLPPPFFKDLYQKVTGNPAPLDRDNIRNALTGDRYRHTWSKMVVKQVSDWKHQSKHSVWDVLDRVMKKSPEMIVHERQRIDSCVWWDEVAAKVPGFDKSGVVWHFHPVGFVGPLVNRKFTWASTPFADLLSSVESRGDYSAYNRTKGGLKAFFNTKLISMKISEVQAKQAKDCREMFAVGKYQIIPVTLTRV